MCSTKDEKYLELKEAINSLDNKNEVMEIQNPRVWWLAFKKKPKSFSFDDECQYQRISQFFDNNDVCYLITELDTIHLFKLPVRNIIKIIGECSFFEYYVTDLKMQNLLCETDHGDLLYL